MSESTGKPTVWKMVNDAMEALGGATTNDAVRKWIWERYPDTNRSTINCQLIAGCVNHPSRVHYNVGARPRPANRPDIDRFFRPGSGRIEMYEPARHGNWEIFESEGKLCVRRTPENATPASNELTSSAPPISARQPTVAPVTNIEPPIAKANKGEKSWVARLQPRIQEAISHLSSGSVNVRVDEGYRLPYACEVMSYQDEQPKMKSPTRYETDLLIFDDDTSSNTWIPRVVIECKLGAVTTHDALTYSAKAATHKHVHPYLRYGMLIGALGNAVPPRVVRHGAHFDFIAVWNTDEPHGFEWSWLLNVIRQEIEASRSLERVFSGKGGNPLKFQMLHRPLRLGGIA